MKVKKLLLAPVLLFSSSLISCGGNYPLTIKRDFVPLEISSIRVDYQDRNSTSNEFFYFYKYSCIHDVYEMFSEEHVKTENRTNYKTELKDCQFIYNVVFDVNFTNYEISYYVYSHTDGTVVYPDGTAHAFYGNAKYGLIKPLRELKNKQEGQGEQTQPKNKELSLVFYDLDSHQRTSFKKPTENELSIQMYREWWLYIYIPDESWQKNKDNLDVVTVNFPEEFYYKYNRSDAYLYALVFEFRATSKFSSKELSVVYKDVSYCVNISSTDYVYSDEVIPTNDDFAGDFSPFKETIDSLTYHEFTSPFPGRDPNGDYVIYENSYMYRHYFENEYDTSYVDYLTDSVYYPTVVDMTGGPVAHRSAKMSSDDKSTLQEGASKTIMSSFTVEYSVMDPDCTHPTNNISFIMFSAKPKTYLEDPSQKVNAHFYLKDIYPEHYYHYELGSLNISMIKSDLWMDAFFEDDTYIYSFSLSLLHKTSSLN